ncbi:MAG: HAD-IIIC family phosphatase [bacterium]|nr:HAD-IIIC family phosphatase [bacterium]
MPDALAGPCAAALKNRRFEVARALLPSIAETTKWAPQLEAERDDLDGFVARELVVFVDYLCHDLSSGDVTWKHLYIGEKLKQVYDPDLSPEDRAAVREAVTRQDAEALVQAVTPHVTELERDRFAAVLDDIHRVVNADGAKRLNVLFVGDCLFLDVMSFLVAPAMEDGIAIEPTYVTSKSPVDQRNALRGYVDSKFDLVFFSPVTYEFSIEYARFLHWRNGRMGASEIERIVDATIEQTRQTLELASDLFDCPVFVHNVSNVLREDSPAKRLVKRMLTKRVRLAARQRFNEWLEGWVAERNRATYEHVFVFDEVAMTDALGEQALGGYFYHSALQHPAVLGQAVAERYRDILHVFGGLFAKKVVVCDLDNTVWDGVIGEGAVRHYQDRQQTLRRLREKGVVLSIVSKNDPANVRWDGAALSDDDFVYPQISWDPKPIAMRRVEEALNIKSKHYVFVDDRADEREMVHAAFPEILGMDATDARTWRALDLWATYLPSNPELDRTRMYKEREERERFVGTEAAAEESPAALFKDLDLQVTIREAAKADLKRVTELINRTNQWNLCGSRTSYREVRQWSSADDARVLVAECADRFGQMGTICVVVVHTNSDAVDIPVFVLSCRVFGYGIETVVLNQIAAMARPTSLPVVGHFAKTPQNQPCARMYADHGFGERDGRWVLESGETPPDPEWLTIKADLGR